MVKSEVWVTSIWPSQQSVILLFDSYNFSFRFNRKKLSLQQRKARVAQKKAYFKKQLGEEDDDEEEGSDDEWASQ